jgi:DNA-binding CsgD family transcriptional regulator
MFGVSTQIVKTWCAVMDQLSPATGMGPVEPGFATVMGPPELPVMGPPAARLSWWSRPAVCDLSRSFDLEVADRVPGGACARGSRDSAALAQDFRGLSLAFTVAMNMWDADRSEMLSNRYVHLTREAGALSELPLALTQHTHVLFLAGELDAAASLIEEVQVATEATGSTFEPYAAMSLAALRGSEVEASALIEAIINNVRLRGEGIGITVAEWSNAVLNNGLGRYQTALSAAQRATENYDGELVFPNWGLVELIEAAARSGSPERATAAMRRLAECTSVSGTDWALGVEARSRALLTDGESADRLYLEAIERLSRTRMGAELARAHLVYGEWLRRENRRTEARDQLRAAHEMLTDMGMEGFADRARRELLATGETVRKRTVDTLTDLTAQEAQIAKLARDGRTNQEIGSQLFISPRTVEWHLGNVFTKLGITSRKDLR